MKIKQQKNLRKHTHLSVTYMKKREWEKRQKTLTVKFKAKNNYYIKKASFGSKMRSVVSIIVKCIHFTSSFQYASNYFQHPFS